MTGPDAIDETTIDHERLETELVTQDRDANRVAMADIVILVHEDRLLMHDPSGKAFDSITQLKRSATPLAEGMRKAPATEPDTYAVKPVRDLQTP